MNHCPPLTVGSLFAGIGGLDLGLEWLGMEVKWQVEIDPFCREVLSRHWPNVERFDDVRKVSRDNLEYTDVICGGFPCQPHSTAGRRKGKDDERYLWPEFNRLLRDLRPRYAIMENVYGLIHNGLGDVLRDLHENGYDAEWDVVAAADSRIGAPHTRQRLFIIAVNRKMADSPSIGPPESGSLGDALHSAKTEKRQAVEPIDGSFSHLWSTEPNLGLPYNGIPNGLATRFGDRNSGRNIPIPRTANGIPRRKEKLTALGNAVVPQVAYVVGQRLLEIHNNGGMI